MTTLILTNSANRQRSSGRSPYTFDRSSASDVKTPPQDKQTRHLQQKRGSRSVSLSHPSSASDDSEIDPSEEPSPIPLMDPAAQARARKEAAAVRETLIATEDDSAQIVFSSDSLLPALHSMLLHGGDFLKYGRRGDPHWKRVMCDEIGCLQWGPVPLSSKQKFSPTSLIKLHEVTTVVKGKHSRVFHRSVAESAPDHLCFSVVTPDRTLDLQTTSNTLRELWVEAITSAVLCAKSGIPLQVRQGSSRELSVSRTVSITREVSVVRTASMSTALWTAVTTGAVGKLPGAGWMNTTLTDDQLQLLSFIDQGEILLKHGRNGRPHARHVMVKKGKVFWFNPEKAHTTTDNPTFVSLLHIKRLVSGKGTPVLAKSSNSVPAELCFSIVVPERSLDLQCPTRESRDRWLRALGFAASKSQDLINNRWLEIQRHGSSSAKSAKSHARSSTFSEISRSNDNEPSVSHSTRRTHSLIIPGSNFSSPFREAGTPTANRVNSLSEDDDADVPATPNRLGEHKHSASESNQDEYFENSISNHLLHHYDLGGEPVDLFSVGVAERLQDKLLGGLKGKELSFDQLKWLAFLDVGEAVIKFGRKGNPKSKWVNVVMGKFFWAPMEKGRTAANSNTADYVFLVDIDKVVCGKTTAVFARSVAAPVSESVCFSLVTPDRTVDIQCESEAQRDKWVHALQFAVSRTKAEVDRQRIARDRLASLTFQSLDSNSQAHLEARPGQLALQSLPPEVASGTGLTIRLHRSESDSTATERSITRSRVSRMVPSKIGIDVDEDEDEEAARTRGAVVDSPRQVKKQLAHSNTWSGRDHETLAATKFVLNWIVGDSVTSAAPASGPSVSASNSSQLELKESGSSFSASSSAASVDQVPEPAEVKYTIRVSEPPELSNSGNSQDAHDSLTARRHVVGEQKPASPSFSSIDDNKHHDESRFNSEVEGLVARGASTGEVSRSRSPSPQPGQPSPQRRPNDAPQSPPQDSPSRSPNQSPSRKLAPSMLPVCYNSDSEVPPSHHQHIPPPPAGTPTAPIPPRATILAALSSPPMPLPDRPPPAAPQPARVTFAASADQPAQEVSTDSAFQRLMRGRFHRASKGNKNNSSESQESQDGSKASDSSTEYDSSENLTDQELMLTDQEVNSGGDHGAEPSPVAQSSPQAEIISASAITHRRGASEEFRYSVASSIPDEAEDSDTPHEEEAEAAPHADDASVPPSPEIAKVEPIRALTEAELTAHQMVTPGQPTPSEYDDEQEGSVSSDGDTTFPRTTSGNATETEDDLLSRPAELSTIEEERTDMETTDTAVSDQESHSRNSSQDLTTRNNTRANAQSVLSAVTSLVQNAQAAGSGMTAVQSISSLSLSSSSSATSLSSNKDILSIPSIAHPNLSSPVPNSPSVHGMEMPDETDDDLFDRSGFISSEASGSTSNGFRRFGVSSTSAAEETNEEATAEDTEFDQEPLSEDKRPLPECDVTLSPTDIARMTADVRAARKVLRNLKAPWSTRTDAMNHIEFMVREQHFVALPNIWRQMDHLMKGIGEQLDDLRTSVVKEACKLLIALAEYLGRCKEFLDTLNYLLPILYRRLYVTIKPISVMADDCIQAVLTRSRPCAPRLIPDMIETATVDPHTIVRSRCTEYLAQILTECKNDCAVDDYILELAAMIGRNINDSEKEVRASTRRLFLSFEYLWPQAASKLLEKFSASTQRTIDSERRARRAAKQAKKAASASGNGGSTSPNPSPLQLRSPSPYGHSNSPSPSPLSSLPPSIHVASQAPVSPSPSASASSSYYGRSSRH